MPRTDPSLQSSLDFIRKNEAAGGTKIETVMDVELAKQVKDKNQEIIQQLQLTPAEQKLSSKQLLNTRRADAIAGDKAAEDRFFLLKPTFGYGTTMDSYVGKTQPEKLKNILLHGVSKKEARKVANQFLLDEVKNGEPELERLIPGFASIPQPAKNSIRDSRHQLGTTGYSKFKKTIKLINGGRYNEAADELARSNLAHQTPKRLKKQQQLLRDATLITKPAEAPGPINLQPLQQLLGSQQLLSNIEQPEVAVPGVAPLEDSPIPPTIIPQEQRPEFFLDQPVPEGIRVAQAGEFDPEQFLQGAPAASAAPPVSATTAPEFDPEAFLGTQPLPTPQQEPVPGLEAPPSVIGGILQEGLGVPPTPQEPEQPFFEDPASAAKFALQKLTGATQQIAETFPELKSIGGRFAPLGAALRGSELVGQEEALQPPPEFVPKATGDQLLSMVIQEGPSLVVGGPALRAAKALPAMVGLSAAKARRSALMAAARNFTSGATSLGILGAAGTGTRQAQEGRFDPAELLQDTGASIALGGVGKVLFGPLVKQMAKASRASSIGKIRAARQAFEPDPVKAFKVTPKAIKQAQTVESELSAVERRIKKNIMQLSKPDITEAKKTTAMLNIAKDTHARAKLEVTFHDTMQGPAYKNLIAAKNHFGSQTTRVAGKNVPVFKQSLSPRGILVNVDEASKLAGARDISAWRASAISATDMLRIVQGADGGIRGPLRRLLIDPVDAAVANWKTASNELKKGLTAKVQELGISSKASRQRLLFRVAEGRASDSEKLAVTRPEQEFINWTATTYKNLLDQINRVNAAHGIKRIKARKNYVTHLQDLTFENRMGLTQASVPSQDTGSLFAKRVRTQLSAEKRRRGGSFRENLIEALDSYIDPAMRRIHMQNAASTVQARAKFLPPNLRKSVDNWVDSAVLGGVDVKDKALILIGAEPIIHRLGQLSGALTRGLILGSLRVVTQQASQVLTTGAATGVKPMVSGLLKAGSNPPARLMKLSSFLTGRTIKEELIPVSKASLKTFDRFAGALLELSDKYVARASWYAGFDRAKSLGLSDPAAVRMADDIGRMLHASYQEIYKPALIRGRAAKAVLPFQTFAFNLWNFVTKDPKMLAELNNSSTRTEFFKIMGSMMATNQIYESLGIASPLPLPTFSDIADTIQDPSVGRFKQAAMEILSGVPVLGSATFGGQVRIPSPTVKALKEEASGVLNPSGFNQSIFANLVRGLFMDDKTTADRHMKRFYKGAAKFAPAGNQIYNTIRGIEAAQKGYYSVGNSDVKLDDLDKFVGVLLGPTASRPVREKYIENQIKRYNR